MILAIPHPSHSQVVLDEPLLAEELETEDTSPKIQEVNYFFDDGTKNCGADDLFFEDGTKNCGADDLFFEDGTKNCGADNYCTLEYLDEFQGYQAPYCQQ